MKIQKSKQQNTHIHTKYTIKRHTYKSPASSLVYTNMGWLGDSSHRGQVCQGWTAVGLPPRYPLDRLQLNHHWTFINLFFSSRSALTLRRNRGNSCWSSSLTLSRSSTCFVRPAGLAKWKLLAPPCCRTTCSWTLSFVSGEIFWTAFHKHQIKLPTHKLHSLSRQWQ